MLGTLISPISVGYIKSHMMLAFSYMEYLLFPTKQVITCSLMCILEDVFDFNMWDTLIIIEI